MLDLSQAFASALWQIVTLNPQLLQIIALSLKVTLTAVAIATLLGFAVGGVLAVYRFPGRGAVAALLNALMGLPPVVAGLIVYLLLSNAGRTSFHGGRPRALTWENPHAWCIRTTRHSETYSRNLRAPQSRDPNFPGGGRFHHCPIDDIHPELRTVRAHLAALHREDWN